MKKRLSAIVREYKFDSVQAFYKELNAAKKEYLAYQAACAEWETAGAACMEAVSCNGKGIPFSCKKPQSAHEIEYFIISVCWIALITRRCKCEKPYMVVLRATKVAHRQRTSRADESALLDCNDCMKRKRIIIVIHLHIAMVFFDRSAYAF